MLALPLKAQGLQHKKICEILGICHDTLTDYCLTYQDGGIEALKQLTFYRPQSKMEASHFVLAIFVGYPWSFSRIFVKSPSVRQRYSILGALNAITHELVTVTTDAYINAISVIEILDKLADKYKGRRFRYRLTSTRLASMSAWPGRSVTSPELMSTEASGRWCCPITPPCSRVSSRGS